MRRPSSAPVVHPAVRRSPLTPVPAPQIPRLADGSCARDAATVIAAVRDALGPFLLEGRGAGVAAAWYDAHVFTPDVLDAAFTPAEVRTLRGFWGRIKALVRCVRPHIPASQDDMEAYALLTGHHLTARSLSRDSDAGMVLRRLERVLDARLFQGTPDAPTVAHYDATLFSRAALEARLAPVPARTVEHLWRRFRRALVAVYPDLAPTKPVALPRLLD